jgi:hypothetical protein
MTDPVTWAAVLKAEWTAIASAPYDFVGALIVGWLIGGLVIGAWYKRSIQNGKDYAALIQRELEIERGQKEGLRKAILELKPEAKPVAIEVQYGDPEVRKVVVSLGQGQTISTPVNPTAPVIGGPVTVGSLSEEEKSKVALLNYTFANGLSQVTSSQPGGYSISASTSLGRQVADYLRHGGATKKSG